MEPQFGAIHGFRGASHSLNKDYDLAIADYGRAIEIAPTKASNYYSRGVAYSSKNEIDKAVADYGKAVELDPRDLLYRYTRGWTYYHVGNKVLAEADFKIARELEKLEENADLVRLIHPTYPKY